MDRWIIGGWFGFRTRGQLMGRWTEKLKEEWKARIEELVCKWITCYVICLSQVMDISGWTDGMNGFSDESIDRQIDRRMHGWIGWFRAT